MSMDQDLLDCPDELFIFSSYMIQLEKILSDFGIID